MGVLMTDTTTETNPPTEVHKWDTVDYYVMERTPTGARQVKRTGVVSELRTQRHTRERQFRVLGHASWLPVSRITRIHEQKDEEE